MDPNNVKILIADDHTTFTESLQRVLNEERDMQVIAIAHDGLEAVNLAKKLRPDAVLMDITMPTMNGIEATR